MQITQTKLNKWSKLADEAEAMAIQFEKKIDQVAGEDSAVVFYYGIGMAWLGVRDAIQDAIVKTPLPERKR